MEQDVIHCDLVLPLSLVNKLSKLALKTNKGANLLIIELIEDAIERSEEERGDAWELKGRSHD